MISLRLILIYIPSICANVISATPVAQEEPKTNFMSSVNFIEVNSMKKKSNKDKDFSFHLVVN